MKNILKISLIAILTLSLMFCIVACGGEETPEGTDNGGNNGGTTDGGNTNGGNTNGGTTGGGTTEGGDENNPPEEEETLQGGVDVEGVWGEFVPIG